MNENKCIITNGEYSWLLEVDGKSIIFQGGFAADYFYEHYSELGYEMVMVNWEYKPDENIIDDFVYYVDIPTSECVDIEGATWLNIDFFTSKEEAVEFTKKHFGSDNVGRISLISRVENSKE